MYTNFYLTVGLNQPTNDPSHVTGFLDSLDANYSVLMPVGQLSNPLALLPIIDTLLELQYSKILVADKSQFSQIWGRLDAASNRIVQSLTDERGLLDSIEGNLSSELITVPRMISSSGYSTIPTSTDALLNAGIGNAVKIVAQKMYDASLAEDPTAIIEPYRPALARNPNLSDNVKNRLFVGLDRATRVPMNPAAYSRLNSGGAQTSQQQRPRTAPRQQQTSYLPYIIVGGVLVVAVGAYFIFRKKNK